jgi:plastocyanin
MQFCTQVFKKMVVVAVLGVALSGCTLANTLGSVPGLDQFVDTPQNTFLLGDDSTQEIDDTLITNAEILYTDFGFEPADLAIKPNTRVVFLNQTASKMWIKSDQPVYSLQPAFDQQDGARAGEWYSVVFLKEGEWKYMNFLNTAQTGTITVKE